MLTVSICAIIAVVAFLSGYIYRVLSKENIPFFPASGEVEQGDDKKEELFRKEKILSEPFSIVLAKKIKENFEDQYSGPTNRFTRTVFLDYQELREYLNEIESVFVKLEELTPPEERDKNIRAMGAYFALTATHVRGSRRRDIVTPADKLAIFLAPVLYQEDEVDDHYPNPVPGGKRKVLKKGSVKDVFGLIEKGALIADDKLAFDISHTEP